MNTGTVPFRTGAVHPLECFKTGWNVIKEKYWLFLGITFVGVLIGSVVPFHILMGPMMCGIYLCMLLKYRGESPSFDMLFKGFDYFAQSLIATLILMVPMLLIMIPFYVVFMVYFITLSERNAEPGAAIFIALFLMFVIILVLGLLMSIFFVLAYPLIADRGLTGIEALKTSAKAAWANLGGLLGFIVINLLLSMAGLMCCYIGIIFVLPISFAAMTAAYLQIFGDREETPSREVSPEGPSVSG